MSSFTGVNRGSGAGQRRSSRHGRSADGLGRGSSNPSPKGPQHQHRRHPASDISATLGNGCAANPRSSSRPGAHQHSPQSFPANVSAPSAGSHGFDTARKGSPARGGLMHISGDCSRPRPSQAMPPRRQPDDAGQGAGTDDVGHDVMGADDAAADGASGTSRERTWRRDTSYSVLPPNEQKRQALLNMAQSEEQAYEQHKQEQREREGSFRATSQRLGLGGSRGNELESVRAAQQQRARVEALTKSVRDKDKRESFRAKEKKKEEEEIRRHKEKQRLKARDLELKKQAAALACQEATRGYWEDVALPATLSDQHGQPESTPAARATFPSQHARSRQHQEDKRRAEEEENARHKATQRAKAELLQARAQEEGKRVQEEVRRAWNTRDLGRKQQQQQQQHQHQLHLLGQQEELCTCTHSGMPAPSADLCTCRDTTSYGERRSSPPLKSCISPSKHMQHLDLQSPSPKLEDQHLDSPSNQRPPSSVSASKDSITDVQRLTECQSKLVELGLPKMSLSELKILLKAHNNDLDRVALLLMKN